MSKTMCRQKRHLEELWTDEAPKMQSKENHAGRRLTTNTRKMRLYLN